MMLTHCTRRLSGQHRRQPDRWKASKPPTTPIPTQPPFIFPSLQIIQYAGDGKWSSEEDWWIKDEMIAFAKQYADACRVVDPDSFDPMLRRHWGDIEWARPPAGHVARPSWWGREHEVPTLRPRDDMTFGEPRLYVSALPGQLRIRAGFRPRLDLVWEYV